MATPATVRPHVRRWGAGTAAIVRLLIAADAPLTQVAIAAAVGVTQPRASQVLAQLAGLDAVRAVSKGYVGQRARLLDLYAQRARPSLAQPESYWYSTHPLAEQARRIVKLARDGRVSVAASADLGPDLLVPWRHPTLTVVYSSDRLALADAGLVPAEGRADSSVILRPTSDRTLLVPTPPWLTMVDGIPLADPIQQWRDLLDLGGDDRREAAARLRRAILSRSIRAAA
jgi:hypothetical protein